MLSRRQLFLVLTGATVGAAGLAGCTDVTTPRRPGTGPVPCVNESALPDFARIGPARTHYEIDGDARSFSYDPDFHARLEEWIADWQQTVGIPLDRIDSYGAYSARDGTCTSWHSAGRAFDISRLRSGDQLVASCREDLWSTFSSGEVTRQRQRYWALAAHLSIHFAPVLTYVYNDAHRNHIHIDNSRSGNGAASFSTRSRTQCQVIQASARYLWDTDCEITGRWDGQTRRHTESILTSLGRRGGMTASDNWPTYLRSSATRTAS